MVTDRHKRHLLIGAVGLVNGRVNHACSVMLEICDEWEPILHATGFTHAVPFDTIHLILYFGTERSAQVVLLAVDRYNDELPVRFELPMAELHKANRDQLKVIFTEVTKQVLGRVAQKFGLPSPRVMCP